MTVYVVCFQGEYETGQTYGVYSSRELAENSWDYKFGSGYDILEFELDLDPNADKPDIDRRPMEGPKTYLQYLMNEMYKKCFLGIFKASSPIFEKKPLPFRSGNEIKFFSQTLPKTPPPCV